MIKYTGFVLEAVILNWKKYLKEKKLTVPYIRKQQKNMFYF